MSSLDEGVETNAGLTFKLLRESGHKANLTVYYEAGIQWRDWSGTWGVMTGKGINKQIERAYGVLASRYRPGDKIILIGYSRGAYAARSLAGVIDYVGWCARIRQRCGRCGKHIATIKPALNRRPQRGFANYIVILMCRLRRLRFGIQSRRWA